MHHPHVVQLYEVIATETSIWLVTELCTGGELFDYLVEKGRIDEYETRALFGQLCLAVAYCHDQGVVHRDLKLENVLLDDHCHVKLSDFGFTREFERGGLLETFCGTTGYASPEMLLGQKYLGQEVDIWSLGIILYALLTGTLPFDDDDEQEMKNKITAGEYEDPDWLSHGMHVYGWLFLDHSRHYRGPRSHQRNSRSRSLKTPQHATNPFKSLVLQATLPSQSYSCRSSSFPHSNGTRN